MLITVCSRWLFVVACYFPGFCAMGQDVLFTRGGAGLNEYKSCVFLWAILMKKMAFVEKRVSPSSVAGSGWTMENRGGVVPVELDQREKVRIMGLEISTS